MIYACSFGLRLLLEVQIAVLWGHAGCPLSGVERCPLLGGSKCSYYFYGKSNRGHEICPLYRGFHLSESPLLEVSLYLKNTLWYNAFES